MSTYVLFLYARSMSLQVFGAWSEIWKECHSLLCTITWDVSNLATNFKVLYVLFFLAAPSARLAKSDSQPKSDIVSIWHQWSLGAFISSLQGAQSYISKCKLLAFDVEWVVIHTLSRFKFLSMLTQLLANDSFNIDLTHLKHRFCQPSRPWDYKT